MGFPELVAKTLGFLINEVEPKFTQDRKYAGATKYQIGHGLGHAQHQDTLDDLVGYLLDKGWITVNTRLGKATWYRVTESGAQQYDAVCKAFLQMCIDTRRYRQGRHRRR